MKHPKGLNYYMLKPAAPEPALERLSAFPKTDTYNSAIRERTACAYLHLGVRTSPDPPSG